MATDKRSDLKIRGTVYSVCSTFCAMCLETIESALKKLDGVSKVGVNLAAERAYVSYNPHMVGLAECSGPGPGRCRDIHWERD